VRTTIQRSFDRDPRLHMKIVIVASLLALMGPRRNQAVRIIPHYVPGSLEAVVWDSLTGGSLARVRTPAAAAVRMFDHFLGAQVRGTL